MATTAQKSTDFQKRAVDFRKTVNGIKLGKKLFSNEVLRLSPAQITQLLKAAGVDVPKEVMITADVAQLIMAGGAISSNIATGAAIKSYGEPSALACQAALDIMIQCNLIEAHSPLADAITLGIDIALIVSSYGTNIIADIKFIVDLVSIAGNHPDVVGRAESVAKKDLYDWLKERRKKQVDALALNFKDYQEGKHSLFGFMGKIAEESPDYFYNYFPEAKVFIPPTNIHMKFMVTSESDTLFGGHTEGSAAAEYDITTIADNSHSAISRALWDRYVGQYLDIYQKTRSYGNNVTKISIIDLAILSMLPPYFERVPDIFHLDELLNAQFLTPNDLDSNIIQDFKSADLVTRQNAFTINGVDYLSQTEILRDEQTIENKNIVKYDESGNISALLKYPRARDRIRNWGEISFIPAYPKYDDNIFVNDSPYIRGYTRNIRNLWSVLSILQQFRTDSYFSDMKENFQRYWWVPSIEDIEEKHKKLLFLSQARHLNAQAYKNIAQFLGVPVSKLKLLRKAKPGQPAIFQ